MPIGVETPDRLYHYTCSHARAKLGKHGTLTPFPQQVLVKYALIWLTDLTTFNPVDLGLQSTLIRCDRTEFCYEIIQPSTSPIYSWKDWCALVHLDRTARSMLELGRRHQHWWVATQPADAMRSWMSSSDPSIGNSN